jgi:hypothetical protein
MKSDGTSRLYLMPMRGGDLYFSYDEDHSLCVAYAGLDDDLASDGSFNLDWIELNALIL